MISYQFHEVNDFGLPVKLAEKTISTLKARPKERAGNGH